MIAAEGEHKASRALRHAAEVITGNPAALQVPSSLFCWGSGASQGLSRGVIAVEINLDLGVRTWEVSVGL